MNFSKDRVCIGGYWSQNTIYYSPYFENKKDALKYLNKFEEWVNENHPRVNYQFGPEGTYGANVNWGVYLLTAMYAKSKTDKSKVAFLINSGHNEDTPHYISWNTHTDLDSDLKKLNCPVISFSVTDQINKKMDEVLTKHGGMSMTSDQLTEILRDWAFGSRVNADLNSDYDKDGIWDVFENAGIALPSGEIIHTEVDKPDSDGDHIKDGDELNVVCSQEADQEYVKVRCKLITWPDDPDSDGDGYEDNLELNIYHSDPMKSDVSKIRWDKGFIYIDSEGKVDLHTWHMISGHQVGYGGYQKWKYLEKKARNEIPSEFELKMMNSGCGLLSATDVLLYLAENHNGYKTDLTKKVNHTSNGFLEYESYFKLLETMSTEGYFPITEIGVLPFSVEGGLNRYSQKYGLNLNATWTKGKDAIDELKIIREMLENDIPVPLLIGYSINKDSDNCKLKLYTELRSAGSERNILWGNTDYSQWHYVTITGLLIDRIRNDAILEVSSFGDRYYISYNELMYYIDCLSLGGDYITGVIKISMQ